MHVSGCSRPEFDFQFLREVVLQHEDLNSMRLPGIVQKVARVIGCIFRCRDRELSLLAVHIFHDVAMLKLCIPANDAMEVLEGVIKRARQQILEFDTNINFK